MSSFFYGLIVSDTDLFEIEIYPTIKYANVERHYNITGYCGHDYNLWEMMKKKIIRNWLLTEYFF